MVQLSEAGAAESKGVCTPGNALLLGLLLSPGLGPPSSPCWLAAYRQCWPCARPGTAHSALQHHFPSWQQMNGARRRALPADARPAASRSGLPNLLVGVCDSLPTPLTRVSSAMRFRPRRTAHDDARCVPRGSGPAAKVLGAFIAALRGSVQPRHSRPDAARECQCWDPDDAAREGGHAGGGHPAQTACTRCHHAGQDSNCRLDFGLVEGRAQEQGRG